jgi:5'-3' exoribonuclease 1
VYEYLEGMQWVMHYYYSGVASWSWFYSYHYAPRISGELTHISPELITRTESACRLERRREHVVFVRSEQALPTFRTAHGCATRSEQGTSPTGILGRTAHSVLTRRLIRCLNSFQDLMYDQNSPIIDFYPEDFELDMNGKKAEWEAIVKIPFIDQERLLKAMACEFVVCSFSLTSLILCSSAREHRLTAEEKQRNGIGTSTRFVYSPDSVSVYPSSLPGFFPAITRCLCLMEPFDLPTLDGLHLVEGLCDGVQLGVEALAGFPSLHTLPHTAQLEHHGVNVFQAESKNQSMVIMIENTYDGTKTEEIARLMVGKRTFIGWPFLTEGLVVAVSDELFRHEKRPFGNGQEKVMGDPHSPADITNWRRRTSRIEDTYSKRFAVITGQVEILLHVRPLRGEYSSIMHLMLW